MSNQNEFASANQPLSLPKTLGQILSNLPLPAISGSTQTPKPDGSSTTTSLTASQWQTGKPLSEHGLTILRNLAANVQRGMLMDDQELRTLLEQHFGSSRLTIRDKINHAYSPENGYNYYIDRYEIDLDHLADSEMKLYDALEFLNRSASHDFIAKQLARVRIVMARRGESNDDLVILIDTYAQHLAEFPADVVKAACDQIIENGKWFPLVSEMRTQMQRLVKFRRTIWQTFQEKRNPLLAARGEAKRLAADPRLAEHWKNLPRSQWMAQHYDWAMEECEKMLTMARAHPHFLTVSTWEENLKKLEDQKKEAGY
jgi:hypothetical protein